MMGMIWRYKLINLKLFWVFLLANLDGFLNTKINFPDFVLFSRKVGHRWIIVCILCKHLWFSTAGDTVPFVRCGHTEGSEGWGTATEWFISWLDSFSSAKYKLRAPQFLFSGRDGGIMFGWFFFFFFPFFPFSMVTWLMCNN